MKTTSEPIGRIWTRERISSQILFKNCWKSFRMALPILSSMTQMTDEKRYTADGMVSDEMRIGTFFNRLAQDTCIEQI